MADGFRCENAISPLLGVTSPSPNELDAASDTRTDMDTALDITAEVVDEQLSRQHLRPSPRTDYGKASENSETANRKQRPGRLEGVVPGVDHPSSKNLGAFALPTSLFEHLAALESAVLTGEAAAGRIPELPASLGGYKRPCRNPLDNPTQTKNDARSKARAERNAISDNAVEVENEQLSCQDHALDIPRLNSPSRRPGRLEDSVPSVDNPCKKKSDTHLQLASASGDASELAVFKHLEALEVAVQNGEALAGRLPELPINLKSPRGQSQPAPPPPCGSSALRAVGGGLLAKAPLGLSNTSPRYFFSEDCYGMQPPSMPGARKHAVNPMAFGHSALRGTPLHQSHHVPHASALWVNTEKSRLYSEASKSYGRSPAIAFLQNDGPRALESLQLELCN